MKLKTPKSRARQLSALYEADEPAWLEAMARLIEERQFADLDFEHLQELLTDLAIREKREVKSRLVQLLLHWLKWDYQPERRGRSWRDSLLSQQFHLADVLESKLLRRHAASVWAEAYGRAVTRAATQTGLEESAFPSKCPWTLEEVLSRKPEPLDA